MNLQTEEIHLLDYWHVLLKRQREAALVFVSVVVLVAVYTFTATPVYEGMVEILFDQERNQTLSFSEGGGGAAVLTMKDTTVYFNTQREIVHSRAFADKVVRKLRLAENPYFINLKNESQSSLLKYIRRSVMSIFPEKAKPANPFPNVKFNEELDPALTDIVLQNVDLTIGKQNDMLKLSYRAGNAAVAAAIANNIANTFIEYNLDMRVKPYRDAAEWLSARLVESKAKVEDTEKSLQQYREGKGIVSFESKESVLTQKLQELITQLVQTEGKRQEAEIKYNQIRSVIDKPELLATVPDIMNNQVVQSLRSEELNIKKQLSELSEKYGSRHPQLIKTISQLDAVQKNIIAEARKMLNAAKADYEVAKSREASLRTTIEQQKQEVLDLSRKAIDFNVIAGESGSNKQFYELLLKKLQEATLSGGMSLSNAQIADYAVTPKSPVKPKRAQSMLLAVLVGLFGGVLTAFFTDYMDDTIKTVDDVDKRLGLPFLNIVPLTDEKKGPLYMLSDPKSATAEAYRTIRTGIMLSSADIPLKVILVTSATPGEGKTTTASNLAVAMAQMGERVLLVDGDMRRHNIHEFFHLSNTVGISDLLMQPERLSEAIKSVDKFPNLHVLTGGTLAPNPLELLGSERMREFISLMKESYDRIIIDSPPLLVFSDSLVLSQLSDGVIMVIWGGKTARNLIRKAADSLKGISTKILGVALNKIDTTRRNYYHNPYYSSYYSSYYTDKKVGTKKKKK